MTGLRSARSLIGRLPLSARLGAAFASVFLLVLTVLIALAHWALGSTLRGELDRALVDAAARVESRALAVTTFDELELGGVESSEVEFQLLSRSGRVLDRTDDDLRRPLLTGEQLRSVLEHGVLFTDAYDGDELQRVLARPPSGENRGVLVLAVEMDSVVEPQAALLNRAGPLAALAGLLAGLTGWLVARRGLAPVTALAEQADALNARDLTRRLELHRSQDEIAGLGRTLNEMLTRIEDARRRERQFTADASHELRTPLAILRGEVELARAQVADSSELARSLDSALEECDRLRDLVDDLLEVARADAGRIDRSPRVDVAQIVDAMLPRFSVLARPRGVALTRRGDAAVNADPRALRRALSNLIDNAVRHAPQGGHVEVAIDGRGQYVTVSVTDDGPGVPPAQWEQVTERFAQGDPSRSGGGGVGLGLAMAASIAAAHDGALELGAPPEGEGLTVTLRIPVVATAASKD